MQLFPWQRRQLPAPLHWQDSDMTWLWQAVPAFGGLPPADRQRLLALAEAFLVEKRLDPVQGLVLKPWMAWAIALQACLPILNLGLALYDHWHTLVVYEGDFVPPWTTTDGAGVVHPVGPHSGESWPRGPVILSWETVQGEMEQGSDYPANVIIHEVCHQIDGRYGGCDGVPKLPCALPRSTWIKDFSKAYHWLQLRQRKGKFLPIDPYALEDPPEFFAVVCEAFFVAPAPLKEYLPEIYGQLSVFFNQDPLTRLSTVDRAK